MDDLVAALDTDVLRKVRGPEGIGVPARDVVIFDASDPHCLHAGSIVLAVGVWAEGDALALIDAAGRCAAAAVVFRGERVEERVAEAACAAGVAVLLVPPEMRWGQLYSLMRTAISTVNAPVKEDAAGVPLGDLFALANAIAAAVGGATTIEDPSNRVLAYSSLGHPIDPARQETILGRQVPSDWIQRLHDAGIFRRLWHTDEVVRIEDFSAADTEYLPRIAVAVRAGGELLGSMWVIEGDQPLGEEAVRALRDSADMAALHLLRHRAATDVDRQRRAEALVSLLEGADRGEVAREALGLDRDRPLTVVGFDVGADTDSDAGAAAVVAAERLADLVAVYCESYRRKSVCAVARGRVYALVSGDSGGDADAAVSLATAVVERARQALRLSVRAGVGSTVTQLDAVAASRREADEVLDVLAAGDRPLATIDAVRAQVILHRLRAVAAAHPELAVGRVATLAEHDAARGTSWIQTLRAYFDAYGDMAAAAARVNVHPNTFRYRLRRISEVFGLDLDDPDERLVAELQLRFLDAAR